MSTLAELNRELQKEIESAIAAHGFRLLDEADAASRYADMCRRFVTGNPATPWLGFPAGAVVYPYEPESWAGDLAAQLPGDGGAGLVFFEVDRPLVCDGPFASVPALIAGCPYVEYCVAPPDLSWVLADTDHNEFVICREQVSAALE